MNDRRPPANIREIARLAGISYATVSRVINQKRGVHPKTRARVLATLRRWNFTPNFFARGLQKVPTGNLGLVMSGCYDMTYAPFLAEVDREVRERGHTVMVSNSYLEPARERRILEDLRHRGVDGILLDPCLRQRAFLESYDFQTPVVLFNKPLGKKLDAFYVDNGGAARKLLAALVRRAPAPYVLVTSAVEREKKRGWAQAARELGLDERQARALTLAQDAPLPAFLERLAAPVRGTYVFTWRQTLGRLFAHLKRDPAYDPRRTVLLPFDFVPGLECWSPDFPMCVFPSRQIARDAVTRVYQRIASRHGARPRKPVQSRYDAELILGAGA